MSASEGIILPLGREAKHVASFGQAEIDLARDDGRFRAVLDVLPAAVYITSAAGRIIYYNDAAAALWGWRPELGTSEWCGSWKLYWPDGRPMPHDQCPMALALRERRPVTNMEAVAERPDGTKVPFIPYPRLLYDASGTLVGAVNLLVDLTDRKCAEQYVQRLALIVESSQDAIISKDLDGVITSWNSGAERLFGYTTDEAIGKSVTILIPSDRLHEETSILDRIRRGVRVERYETIRRRKDGSLVEISLIVSPIRDADGRVIGASKIAHDITERRRAQEQQQLLVAEIKHRIKNTLATVQAIAMQTMRTASIDEREAFVGRLHALASAHDLVTLENWNRASMRDVVCRALDAFRGMQRNRFLLNGPDNVWLDASRSLLLAIAVHELATNAVKYGALSTGNGKVSVAWKYLENDGQRRAQLRWQESGGPPVKPPVNKGFGSHLLERAFEGGIGSAHLDYDPQGLACVLEMATI
jgi:two-component system, chemotaxis family, CheB/CheR fusion protein